MYVHKLYNSESLLFVIYSVRVRDLSRCQLVFLTEVWSSCEVLCFIEMDENSLIAELWKPIDFSEFGVSTLREARVSLEIIELVLSFAP